MGQTKQQILLKEQGLRLCIICKDIKSRNNFHIKRYYRNPDNTIKYTSLDTRCKSCMYTYNRELRISSPEQYCKSIIAPIRHRAKEQNVPFNIDGPYLYKLWQDQDSKCFYSNEILDLSYQTIKRNHPHLKMPSLDRQIPELGYVHSNLVWCLYYINRMKNNLTHKEFISFCYQAVDKFPIPA